MVNHPDMQTPSQLYPSWIAALSFLIPVSLLHHRSFEFVTWLTALWGVGLLFWDRYRIQARQLTAPVALAALLILLWYSLTLALSGRLLPLSSQIKWLESPLRLVFLTPSIAVLGLGGIHRRLWVYSSSFTLMVMTGLALYQLWGLGHARAHGWYTYHNLLAYVQVGLILSLTAWRHHAPPYVFIGGLLAGLFSCLATGTRSAWPALLLLPWLWWFTRTTKTFAWREHVRWLVALALAFSALMLNMWPRLHDRVIAISNDWLVYHEQDALDSNSLGARIHMWQLSLQKTADHPLLGSGSGSFYAEMQVQTAQGRLPPFFASYKGPHNLYLLLLVEQGILGSVLILSLVFSPLWTRANRYTPYASSPERKLFVFFLIASSLFFLGESIIERHQGLHWFAYFWLLMYGLRMHSRFETEVQTP